MTDGSCGGDGTISTADQAAAAALLARIAIAQDEHDWETLTDCFEPDAAYEHPGGRMTGRDAIVARSRRALDRLDASQHLIGTITVTPDGDGSLATT